MFLLVSLYGTKHFVFYHMVKYKVFCVFVLSVESNRPTN